MIQADVPSWRTACSEAYCSHNQVMHLGTANTLASERERELVETEVKSKSQKSDLKCSVRIVFSTRPYGVPSTSALPERRVEDRLK